MKRNRGGWEEEGEEEEEEEQFLLLNLLGEYSYLASTYI